MRPVVKRSLGAVAVVALMLLSAFAGGTYGFMQGYVHGLGDTSVKAATLTTALRAMRNGELEKAISSLESDLDTLIIEHWATGRSDPPILSWLVHSSSSDVTDRKLFARVARYRDEYPSAAVVPEVRSAIAAHLKSFQSP